MDTDRPLEMAVRAAREMMAGDESSALATAKLALIDAATCSRCRHMEAVQEAIDEFPDRDELNKQMAIIGLLVAAARDHSPSEVGALY